MVALLKSRPSVGFALGIAIILAAILRIPPATQAIAGMDSAHPPHCPVAEVSLDEGYGLTRKELRPVCAP